MKITVTIEADCDLSELSAWIRDLGKLSQPPRMKNCIVTIEKRYRKEEAEDRDEPA